MKWAYYIKYKLAAVALLAGIILVILSGNLLERDSYTILDSSMTSIYKDRLQVSRYIYDISNALYKKRMTLEEQPPNGELTTYNQAIEQSILAYEKTILTKEERTEWESFKGHLALYNEQEQGYTNNTVTEAALQSHFERTITNLDALMQIQVGEGQHILNDSHAMVSNRLVFSFFEISLLIVLGLCALVIMSTIDKRLFPKWQNRPMN